MALRFAVLGHPIAHSISPAMHAAAYRAAGLSHTYEAIDVRDENALEGVVVALRRGVLAGANVTVPYKRSILSLVDDIDPSAAAVGAANTLVRTIQGRVVAHNTDAAGLADDLRALGATGRTAAIIGAGGGASAAVAACASLGASVIAVTSRSWDSSEALVASLEAERIRGQKALTCVWPIAAQVASSSRLSRELKLQWADLAAGADIIVQATSAGMSGLDAGDRVASIVPWDRVRSERAIAYDLVYNPPETPFLAAARARGIRASGGLGMLVRQGARAFTLWLGITPSIDIMRAAAERALGIVR